MREVLIQSAMKLGCRSQSWYIISQKQDMIAMNASRRGSAMFTTVRFRTRSSPSVLEAPLGTSL